MAEFETETAVEAADSGAMSDGELASLCQQFESQCVGEEWDEIAAQQEKAINYYYRRPFGDEAPGQSSVVDGTVAIVIDNAMAAILKPFVSADDAVSFSPRGPEDEDQAEQATEYVNYVLTSDNPGFSIFHNWFKDALLTKLGIVKVWWEDTSYPDSRQELVDAMTLEKARMEESYGGEVDNDDGTFTVSFNGIVEDGRVRVEVIPPEEFKIAPYSRSVADCPYVCHSPNNFTRSDLYAFGVPEDVIDTIPAMSAANKETGREAARYEDERYGSSDRMLGTPHRSQELIALKDEYIRVDYDGDGVAELRHVIRVADTILFNEEVEEVPFAVLCPIPMPHKVYGLSLADQVVDLQRISSVLWRQMLDNLYKSNNPRPHIPMGSERADGSTADSLMDTAPGAAVLEGNVPIRYEAIPFTADKVFPALEYAEQQQEARSGVGRAGQGLDTNALKKSGQMTATEMAMIQSGKNARVEMIARIFAETGVKDLYRLILKMLVRYQPQSRLIRLRNEWVGVDPRGWNPDMDLRINVGLGMGERSEQIAQADSVLETMANLIQTPFASLVTKKNAYEAVKRKYNAAGIKDVDEYLTEPDENEQEQQQPDPEAIKAQAEAQLQQQKLQGEQAAMAAKIELAQQEAQAKLQLQREQFEAEAHLAREKAALETELALQRMEQEMQLAERRMQMEESLAERKASMAEKSVLSKTRPGGSLAE